MSLALHKLPTTHLLPAAHIWRYTIFTVENFALQSRRQPTNSASQFESKSINHNLLRSYGNFKQRVKNCKCSERVVLDQGPSVTHRATQSSFQLVFVTSKCLSIYGIEPIRSWYIISLHRQAHIAFTYGTLHAGQRQSILKNLTKFW